MNAYFLVIIEDILLSVVFACQKKYQNISGSRMKAGLFYNGLTGLFSAVMFLFINQFDVKITGYSILMAALFATVIMLYIILGFKIMEKGNMSLYTLFLMAGGMTVPYVWGVIFLNEELTLLRTLGLLVIIAAVTVANASGEKTDKKQLLLCVAVFFLNGTASVISKTHQISPAQEVVTSPDFAFLVMTFKAVACSLLILFNRKKFFVETKEGISFQKILPVIVLASLADGISYMCQLMGAAALPATVLFPLVTGGTVILSAFAGFLAFREKPSQKQWIGVALCFVGTLLFL